MKRRIFISGLLALSVAAPALSDTSVYYAPDGAALRGYDIVSYFADNGPVQGRSDQAVMWKGAVWFFASAENREAFEANPRAFAPQFGGYCAYAVAQGYTLGADPKTWRIVDNKLYLIHSPEIEKVWARDVAGNIARADSQWPQVLASQ